jgi:beta-lactam-binding protein with PASTA domain
VRICPSCKSENPDDADFCSECNAYLRWEPTVMAPSVGRHGEEAAATPPAAPPPAAPVDGDGEAPAKPAAFVAQRLPVIKEGMTAAAAASAAPPAEAAAARASRPEAPVHTPTKTLPAEAETVTITLRLPDEEGAGANVAATGVDPGGQSSIRALVRNQSGIVDNYDLAIEGMPPEWWTITPATVYLVPFGAPGGDYEQEVEIRLHPPRSPEAEARLWPLRVVASSKAQAARVGSATINATIAPYQELETEIRPERAGGRRKAKFAVAARNRANAPLPVVFSAVDSDNAMRFDFDEASVTAPPGKRAGTVFRAHPAKQIWLGRPVDRRFQVSASVPGSETPSMPRQAVLRQKPWIAWWVPIAVPILAAAAAAVYVLLPHNVTVPNLQGQKPFAAQQLLESKGLALGQTGSGDVAPRAALVGLIESQSRKAGAKVKKGTAISVTVWVGTGKVAVPDLKGKTLNQARTALDQLKLGVGAMTPQPTDPDKAKIVSESPAAGTSVASGSTVDLFFAASAANGAKKKHGSGGGGGKQALKHALQVPPLAGLAGAAALGKLSALGFGSVQRSPALSDSALGTIVGQSPSAGTKVAPGTPIQVFISTGLPQIAYDDGRQIVVMTGSGRIEHRLGAGTEPSWQPGGSRRVLVYESADHKIVKVDSRTGPPSAVALTTGPDDRRPVFSPDGKTVAFIRTVGGSDRDLCFVSAAGGTASCITDPNVSVDRPSWSPDGKAIVTIASASGSSQFQAFLYTSTKPDSARAADWVAQGLKLPPAKASDQVNFVAFSPDAAHPRLAVVANYGSSSPSLFNLFLAPWTPTGGIGKPVSTGVTACTVGWRPDGKEVAVEQSSDCGNQPNPKIVRVDPDNPSHATPLPPVPAYDPAWQYVDLTPH